MYCFDRSTIYVQTAPTKTFAKAKLREKQQLNAIKVQNNKKTYQSLKICLETVRRKSKCKPHHFERH